MPTDLAGLPIAITGASSGIGLAAAFACAKAGMPVALAARREDRLRDAVDAIERQGGRAIAVRCDVTSPADCEALVARTIRAFGSIYSIFANAGYGIEGPVHKADDAAWRAIFETNFWGTLNTIRPALPPMLAARRGHVLICTSCVSKLGIPYLSAYSATKACQDHVGRAMRHELRGRVHVSTVHPIGTDTEFSRIVTEHSRGAPRRARSPEGFRQTPQTVADAVVRCLRRPTGEVWTSLGARLLAGLGNAFPGLADHVLSKRFAPAPD
jgi:NAD(P)-dependent dehydrogenase (short-subunit alcohol dehydrogenase family)